MCQPRKWWWGLLPLVALWAGSVFVLTPQIESELTHRVTTAVRKDMPWLKTAVEGRDISIEGEAPSDELRRQAVNAVLNTDGVRLAISSAGLMPEAKPFAWGASRDAAKVTMTGHVAPDGSREQMLGEARKLMPGATIVDEMKDARGAPAGAVAMTGAALATLAKLKSGSVALVDNTLAIKGVAADQAGAAAIIAAARKLPPPLKLGSVDVTAQPGATVAAPPVAPVAPKAATVATERPYTWQGVREGNAVALSGFVPSEAARTQVMAAAKSALGGGRVVDQLKVAAGLPAAVDFGAATGFALVQLGQLRNGTAKLVDSNLTIEGEALDATSYRAVVAATSGNMPGGIKLERAALSPPRLANYAWSAVRDEKTLTLSGSYPDDDTRQMMLQAVAQRFADLKLIDRTAIASGAPAGFPAAMGMGLDQLSRLMTGDVSIANGRITVSGLAPGQQVASEIKDALTKLVGGIPAESRVTFLAPPSAPAAPAPVVAAPAPASVPAAPTVEAKPAAPVVAASPPPAPIPAPVAVPPAAVAKAAPPAVPPAPVPAKPSAVPKVAAAAPPIPAAKSVPAAPAAQAVVVAGCPSDLGAAFKSGRIRFGSSSTTVLPSSRKTIDNVAGVLKRCGTLKIEVAGHTDSTGSAAFNDRLSMGRAEAIRSLLVERGVEAVRIKASGFGSSKPVADNVTPAGKARNRRIEFNVAE